MDTVSTTDKKTVRLGDALLASGIITPEQLAQALEKQKENRGKRLGELLQELHFVTERQLLEALSRTLGVRLTDVSALTPDLRAVELLPRRLAEKYTMLPIACTDGTITIVTNDPLNLYAQEDVRQLTGRQIELLLGETGPLKTAIQHSYTNVSMRMASQRADSSSAAAAARQTPMLGALEAVEGDSADDAPIINLLNSLIQQANAVGASDIHIEPFEDKTSVRMRIDGTIVECVTLQPETHAPLIARIKILSNLDIAERRVPQDGHCRFRLAGEYINIRVSVIPTVFGETAVLRLLTSARNIDYPDSFGMTPDNCRRFQQMLRSPNGIIYLTGPTGSGKTTTLYMVLEQLCRRQVNICTIEDPVEKNIPRINQTQVNNVSGLTFESGMRALLRQDPDIIMVGETRDTETAATSVRAAITGHLVFSTLHTNSAVSSVIRLEDMGIENYMIANSLVGVVAQRLMRKVCPHCAVSLPATEEEKALLGEGIAEVKRPVGCPHCSNTGYAGRIAIHEILYIDKPIRAMISRGATMEEIEKYAVAEQGMRLLCDSARDLVAQGVTTVEELMKVAYYA